MQPRNASILIPTVIEKNLDGGARLRHLLAPAQGAHHLLGTEIDDTVANLVIAQLLFLDSEDPGKDINSYNQLTGRQRVCRAGDV